MNYESPLKKFFHRQDAKTLKYKSLILRSLRLSDFAVNLRK